MATEEINKCRTTSQLIKCAYHWEIDNFSYFCRDDSPITESEKDKPLKSSSFSPVPNPYSMQFHLELTPYPKCIWDDSCDEQDYYREKLLSMKEEDEFEGMLIQGVVNLEVFMTLKKFLKEPVHFRGKLYFLNGAGEKHFIFELENPYTSFWDFERALFKINRSEFLKSDFLPNDKLTIICEISFLADIATSDVSKNNLDQLCEKAQKLSLESYRSLMESGKHSDVVICVDEGEEGKTKEFSLHKLFLSEKSSVFEAMFKHEMEEAQKNRVDITDVKVDVFEVLIRYIYYGNIEQLDKYAMELMEVADKYDIAQLKLLCGEYLGGDMSLDNVIDLLVLADMHNANELKDSAIDFIKKNYISVVKSEKWKSLFKKQPKLFGELLDLNLGD